MTIIHFLRRFFFVQEMTFHHFHNGISPPDHININILTKMKTEVFFSGNDIIDFCLAIIYLVFWSSAWFMGFTNVQLRSDYGLFLNKVYW